MPKEIFDQERPRSVKARRFEEAFAGCEEWTVAPPSSRRRDELDLAPWLSSEDGSEHEEHLPRAA